jgi:hypothetical protein
LRLEFVGFPSFLHLNDFFFRFYDIEITSQNSLNVALDILLLIKKKLSFLERKYFVFFSTLYWCDRDFIRFYFWEYFYSSFTSSNHHSSSFFYDKDLLENFLFEPSSSPFFYFILSDFCVYNRKSMVNFLIPKEAPEFEFLCQSSRFNDGKLTIKNVHKQALKLGYQRGIKSMKNYDEFKYIFTVCFLDLSLLGRKLNINIDFSLKLVKVSFFLCWWCWWFEKDHSKDEKIKVQLSSYSNHYHIIIIIIESINKQYFLQLLTNIDFEFVLH